MTEAPSLQLDHVGFLLDDVDEVRQQLIAAGFELSPVAELHGADGGPSGGVNCTSTFPRAYLEFQELTASGRGHPLESRWSRRPCVAVVAFRSHDLGRDVERLGAAGRLLSEPEYWSRATPEGQARVRFATYLDASGGPVVIVVEHLTPHLTIGTGHVQPNGVWAVDGVVVDGLERPIEGPLDVPAGEEPWSVSRLRLASQDGDRTRALASRAGWSLRGEGVVDTLPLLGVDLEIVTGDRVR